MARLVEKGCLTTTGIEARQTEPRHGCEVHWVKKEWARAEGHPDTNLAGALLMGLRLAVALVGGWRLRKGAQLCDDPWLLD